MSEQELEHQMQGGVNKRPISRAAYDALDVALRDAHALLMRVLEDAADEPRGWSDAAAVAQFAASTEPYRRAVALAEAELRSVFPDDDVEQMRAYRRRESNRVMSEARARANIYRMEIWNRGQFVRSIPFLEGPTDPAAIAEQLRGEGVIGELRLILRAPGAPQEHVVQTHALAPGQRTGPQSPHESDS